MLKRLLLHAIPVVAGWVVFHGAFRYGFAQDDWIRLETAGRPLNSLVSDLVTPGSEGRRPVEFLYFWLASRVFGASALAFHLLAALIHSGNVILLHLLLRRLLSAPLALLGAVFFAAHIAGFTVLYWVACAPELLAMHFSLLTLVLAASRRRHPGWSVIAYLFALGSKETAVLVPLLVWLLGRNSREPGQVRRRVLPLLAVSATCVAYYIVVKAGFSSPAYAYDPGLSALYSRFATYLAWAHAIGSPIGFISQASTWSGTVAILATFGALAFAIGLGGRTGWIALAGFAWLMVAVAPAVLIAGHQYRYLLYIGLPGVVLLWSPLLEAILARVSRRRPSLVTAGIRLAALAISAAGAMAANATELDAASNRGHWSRNHFVVRRALAARKTLEQVSSHTPPPPGSTMIFMSPDGSRDWWDENFIAALGGGAALRVHLRLPDLLVLFVEAGDDPVDLTDREDAVLYLYEKDGSVRLVRDSVIGSPVGDRP